MSYEKYNWEVGDTLTSNRLNNIQEGIDNMSSSYQKTIWVDGDIITAEKLNNIENGIKNIADQDSSDDSWIIGDGKTRFHISIPEGTPNARRKFAPFIQSDEDTVAQVTIDWGDGTVETVGANSIQLHTYDNCGNYVITINVMSGSIQFSPGYAKMVIKRLEIGDSVTSIADNAFSACVNLISVIIPDSVTNIGNYAFYGCSNLTNIIIPDSVTSIADNAFSDCVNLTNIIIPDSVISIGINAFYTCANLISVIIPDSVTSIGKRAFANCRNLTSVIIPDLVTTIGDNAFSACLSMLEYHIKPTVPPMLANGAFANIPSDCIIYVPEESVDAYKSATNWSAYANQIQAEPAN